jgi:hypothetical protein
MQAGKRKRTLWFVGGVSSIHSSSAIVMRQPTVAKRPATSASYDPLGAHKNQRDEVQDVTAERKTVRPIDHAVQ